jgi:hypothetical protein
VVRAYRCVEVVESGSGMLFQKEECMVGLESTLCGAIPGILMFE